MRLALEIIGTFLCLICVTDGQFQHLYAPYYQPQFVQYPRFRRGIADIEPANAFFGVVSAAPPIDSGIPTDPGEKVPDIITVEKSTGDQFPLDLKFIDDADIAAADAAAFSAQDTSTASTEGSLNVEVKFTVVEDEANIEVDADGGSLSMAQFQSFNQPMMAELKSDTKSSQTGFHMDIEPTMAEFQEDSETMLADVKVDTESSMNGFHMDIEPTMAEFSKENEPPAPENSIDNEPTLDSVIAEFKLAMETLMANLHLVTEPMLDAIKKHGEAHTELEMDTEPTITQLQVEEGSMNELKMDDEPAKAEFQVRNEPAIAELKSESSHKSSEESDGVEHKMSNDFTNATHRNVEVDSASSSHVSSEVADEDSNHLSSDLLMASFQSSENTHNAASETGGHVVDEKTLVKRQTQRVVPLQNRQSGKRPGRVQVVRQVTLPPPTARPAPVRQPLRPTRVTTRVPRVPIASGASSAVPRPVNASGGARIPSAISNPPAPQSQIAPEAARPQTPGIASASFTELPSVPGAHRPPSSAPSVQPPQSIPGSHRPSVAVGQLPIVPGISRPQTSAPVSSQPGDSRPTGSVQTPSMPSVPQLQPPEAPFPASQSGPVAASMPGAPQPPATKFPRPATAGLGVPGSFRPSEPVPTASGASKTPSSTPSASVPQPPRQPMPPPRAPNAATSSVPTSTGPQPPAPPLSGSPQPPAPPPGVLTTSTGAAANPAVASPSGPSKPVPSGAPLRPQGPVSGASRVPVASLGTQPMQQVRPPALNSSRAPVSVSTEERIDSENDSSSFNSTVSRPPVMKPTDLNRNPQFLSLVPPVALPPIRIPPPSEVPKNPQAVTATNRPSTVNQFTSAPVEGQPPQPTPSFQSPQQKPKVPVSNPSAPPRPLNPPKVLPDRMPMSAVFPSGSQPTSQISRAPVPSQIRQPALDGTNPSQVQHTAGVPQGQNFDRGPGTRPQPPQFQNVAQQLQKLEPPQGQRFQQAPSQQMQQVQLEQQISQQSQPQRSQQLQPAEPQQPSPLMQQVQQQPQQAQQFQAQHVQQLEVVQALQQIQQVQQVQHQQVPQQGQSFQQFQFQQMQPQDFRRVQQIPLQQTLQDAQPFRQQVPPAPPASPVARSLRRRSMDYSYSPSPEAYKEYVLNDFSKQYKEDYPTYPPPLDEDYFYAPQSEGSIDTNEV